MTGPIYLDHNATTPLAPGVLETMTRYLSTEFGNPSSSHHYGQAAAQAIATARAQIGQLIGAQPPQLVFTGCASDANTLAIIGATTGHTGHVITRPPSTSLSSRPAKPLPGKASVSLFCPLTSTAWSGRPIWPKP